ncbi:DUF1127 domain-containing protein [Pseudomonas sp. ANT_H12B]|uniref:DUF1127 domain-containing protein n=1 Tax=Pseudomonas sp. ANT_H12B TaxID=2597348 RepID=UPI0011EE918D|nr:DUF1127 domain-containing protein [Pseudomonas sp. ANT_H12B]KAA0956305.1 DUF1127 domain-containing protein [Pseudomonas sp. ANT_H12B]
MNQLRDLSVTTPQAKPRLRWFRELSRSLATSQERARTRRLLGQLNEHQLSDLSISLADRLNELDKPFWR